MIGAGWLGRALGRRLGVEPLSRRAFDPSQLSSELPVVVASGRAWVPSGADLTSTLRKELTHLRRVLDAAVDAGARRIVVLGSSDVAGMNPRIDGSSAQDPRTPYATVKAALEDECTLGARHGVPITCLRLAPVHGPGKRRTQDLIRLARAPVVILPNGGWHSVGFILLDDAVEATVWLLANETPAPVVSAGAGEVRLRDLLSRLAEAQGRTLRALPVPAPPGLLRRVARMRLPVPVQWAFQLSVPRQVAMEVPVDITPLEQATKAIVATA